MALHRELGLQDYWALLLRRRRLLIIPAILGAVAGYLLSLVLPAKYTSHTMVLVEEPIIPDSYVRPVVNEDVNQRLASMQGQILSRTRLQHLVEQFHLYKKDVGAVPTEVLIEWLKKSIKVAPLNPMPGTLSRGLPGFTVDVTLSEARLAQQVCTEITSMFMEQNLHLRQQQAEDTTQFLAKQLEEAKAKLDEQDAKLAAFQSRNMGALPEDEKTNLTLLTGMTPQLEAVTQGLNQARQEKTFVESLLTQQLAALKSSANGQNPQTLEQQLSEMQSKLVSLQRSYTDKHPSVVKLKHEIAQLQKQIEETATQDQGAPSEQKSRDSGLSNCAWFLQRSSQETERVTNGHRAGKPSTSRKVSRAGSAQFAGTAFFPEPPALRFWRALRRAGVGSGNGAFGRVSRQVNTNQTRRRGSSRSADASRNLAGREREDGSQLDQRKDTGEAGRA